MKRGKRSLRDIKKGQFARQDFRLTNVLRLDNSFTNSRRAQVWVETVIYTLIGLAVIGILLAIAKPKIDEIKDKAAIEQSIEILDVVNEKIQSVRTAPGNRRVVDLKVGKGKFVVDSEGDAIYWIIENSEMRYSEPGSWVSVSGHLKVLTKEASPYTIILNMTYPLDLRYDNSTSGEKEFNEAPTPYSLKIENKGTIGDNVVIDFAEE